MNYCYYVLLRWTWNWIPTYCTFLMRVKLVCVYIYNIYVNIISILLISILYMCTDQSRTARKVQLGQFGFHVHVKLYGSSVLDHTFFYLTYLTYCLFMRSFMLFQPNCSKLISMLASKRCCKIPLSSINPAR